MFDFWHIMDKCTAVAKRELFFAWPFGLAAWLAGLIFIDRVNSKKAHCTMNDAADEVKKLKVTDFLFILFSFLLL